MGRYAHVLGALLRKSWAQYCEHGVCTDVFEDEAEIQPAQAGGASAGTTVKPSDSGSAGPACPDLASDLSVRVSDSAVPMRLRESGFAIANLFRGMPVRFWEYTWP